MNKKGFVKYVILMVVAVVLVLWYLVSTKNSFLERILTKIPIAPLHVCCVDQTTTQTNNIPIPDAPNLAFNNGSKLYIAITWNYNIADEFNIYRSSDVNTNWEKILSKYPGKAHAAVDYDYPKNAKILFYRITALDKDGNEGSPSTNSQVSISTEIPGTSDWKTYTSDYSYGAFEIKYPPNFKVNTTSDGTASLSSGNIRIYPWSEQKLSVPLDYTFGGRYTYTENQSLDSRVFSEKYLGFTKDYFLAYGGLGSWDMVINAYQYKNGNYYIISWYLGPTLGVPGDTTANGTKISKQEIINKTLAEMRDQNNENIKVFNQILSTFKFTK